MTTPSITLAKILKTSHTPSYQTQQSRMKSTTIQVGIVGWIWMRLSKKQVIKSKPPRYKTMWKEKPSMITWMIVRPPYQSSSPSLTIIITITLLPLTIITKFNQITPCILVTTCPSLCYKRDSRTVHQRMTTRVRLRPLVPLPYTSPIVLNKYRTW